MPKKQEIPTESEGDEQLKNKAMTIRGKQYVLVKDRIMYFHAHFPNGSIQTELVTQPLSKYIIVKATIYPDASQERSFTGYSQAIVGDVLWHTQ